MDSNRPSEIAALHRAVEVVGSQSAMGRMLGVSQRAVWRWLKENKPLPAEHVLLVERETGIPKEVLRPDIYPTESAAPRVGLEPAR